MTIESVTDFASEMGIAYEQFLDMTWREYDYYSIGYLRRIERGWDRNRHLVASMFNSSGFSKTKVKATDVMSLPLLDMATPKIIKRVSDEVIKQRLKILSNGGH